MTHRQYEDGAIGLASPPDILISWTGQQLLASDSDSRFPSFLPPLNRWLDLQTWQEPVNPVAVQTPMPAAQSMVVSQALGCPDLFLIDVAPELSRELAVFLSVEAARHRQERVLLIAPRYDLNTLFEKISSVCPELSLGRCLGRDEASATLPRTIAQRTAGEIASSKLREELHQINQSLQAADQRVAEIQTLVRKAEEFARLQSELAELRQNHEQNSNLEEASQSTPADPANDTELLEAEQLAKESAEVVLRLQAELEAAQTNRAGLFGFLKNLFGGADPTEQLSRQIGEATSRAKEAEERLLTLTQLRQAAAEETANQEDRREAEKARSASEFEAALADLQTRQQSLAESLGIDGNQTPDQVDIEPVAERLQRELETAQVDRDAIIAERRERLERQNGQALSRELSEVRLVLGSIEALGHDPFLPNNQERPLFDRLVILDSTQTPDQALVTGVRLSQRQVLVGDAGSDLSETWARLWDQFHHPDWAFESDRLVVRLAPSVGRMHSEALLDRPEIELRFDCDDETNTSILAEIAFPSSMTMAEAKAFIANECDEWRMQTFGPYRLHESASSITVCWPLAEEFAADREIVEVRCQAGVTEYFVTTDTDPICVKLGFDTEEGWDVESVQDFLQTYTSPSQKRRTAHLPQ